MKGYKTVVVNGAAAALPMLDLVVNNGAVLGSVLGPHGATALSILGIINVLLRWVTTTPVFQSEQSEQSEQSNSGEL